MKDPIVFFSNHITNTSINDFPEQTLTATKKFIIDTIGVGIFGSSGPWANQLIKSQDFPENNGIARVIGSRTRLDPTAAALCNAYQMHNSEFDCFHEGAVVHPMTCVLSASIAEIDKQYFNRGREISGTKFLEEADFDI